MNYKRALILGGTGFLGQILIEYLLKDKNIEIIKCFARNESRMMSVMQKFRDKRLSPEIGDICDLLRVTSIMKDCDLVINAAAMKRVDSCNLFPMEAVKVNILGVFNLLHAAINDCLNLKKVIYISTDKSCNATNLYGKTKGVAESMLLQRSLKGDLKMIITITKWGNCLNSTGSFFPYAIKMIRNNLPIYLTHSNMTRFLMTKRMILDVIDKAVKEKEQSKIILPEELWAIKIETALKFIKEYFGSNSDIIIKGIENGEKLAEELEGRYSNEPKYQITQEKFLSLLKEEGLI